MTDTKFDEWRHAKAISEGFSCGCSWCVSNAKTAFRAGQAAGMEQKELHDRAEKAEADSNRYRGALESIANNHRSWNSPGPRSIAAQSLTNIDTDFNGSTAGSKSELNGGLCTWVRAFDHNFNISCVGETGQRASGNFKGKKIGAKWEFIYCPYCGRKIADKTT